MNKRQVQDAMNKGFSHLEFTGDHQREVLSRVRGEKPVKRKLSVGLVFAVVLLLVAFAAVAATLLWENYAAQVKRTENEQGTYVHWQTKDKIDLVKALIEMGYVEETDETDRLFDSSASEEDVHIIADQLLMDLTQRDAGDISAAEITYAVMGYFTAWTPEQRVWWQELMGYESGAVDTFVRPGSHDISEEDAIRIAKNRLIEAYGFERDYFDKDHVDASADLYTTNNRPDYRRWMVIFSIYRGGSNDLERAYSAVVDNTGTVIADPDVEMPLPGDGADRAMNELSDKKGHYIFWTHEERARYKPERFAMPAPEAISEEEAVRIAWEAARSHERTRQRNLDGYAPFAMYGAAIPDNELNPNEYWVVTLAKNLTKDYTNEGEVNVYMDAGTGEVYSIF